MATEMSQQVYPRPIVREDTPEQMQADLARAHRKAIHWQLHELFALADAVLEETFGGKMNLPPERSESETGCSLTQPFLVWLETHELPDPTEARRRRQLWQAFQRLQRERPDICLIVETHARTHASLTGLASRWRVGNKTVIEGYAAGLDLMLGWLGPD